VHIPKNSTSEQVTRIAAGVTPSARQLSWQEMELTTFLHFSMNTFYDQEWGHGTESPARFNPSKLDAEQWVRVCREAGSKCVIITCKHHDGFCLWPSRYTDHSVAASPWKNGKGDVVKEVSQACRHQGVKFGIYLSPWDRHEKTYGTEQYNQHFRDQLTELLTNYGDISEVWFDGACGEGPNGKKQVYDWESYYSLIRKMQPNAVIAVMGPDVRWVGTESGYGRETEWSVVPYTLANQDAIAAGSQQQAARDGCFVPAGDMTGQDLGSREAIQEAKNLIWYPSEVDVSIRPGWFWHGSENSRVKSPGKLLDIYFSSVGRNSLLLINIPPDSSGLISENDINSLQEWRLALNSIFRNNLAAHAKATSGTSRELSSIPNLFDGNDSSSWQAAASNELRLELDLGENSTFDVLLLQENIRQGQRIEKFRLQALVHDQWIPLTEGTSVGYKRLLRFAPVTCSMVRLIIEQSRGVPALSEFGLYLQPPVVTASPSTAAFTDSVKVSLASNSAEASVYYTTDGSVPGLQSRKYTEAVEIRESTRLKFVALLPGGERSFYGESSYNKAKYGVILKNAPSKEFEGGGPLGLVDGVEGSLDFGDGKWTGINGKDLDATVDLGKLTEIHSVTLAFNETTASWIFRPTEVIIELSEDGKTYIPVKDTRFTTPSHENAERLVITAVTRGKARFVHVIGKHLDALPDWHAGKGLPAWVFADEIRVE